MTLICMIIGGVLVGMSAFLLTGRGGFLIAGFNTMPKEQKAKWNEKALCRFIGMIMLPIGIMVALIGIEAIMDWFIYVFMGVTIVLVFFAIIYANGGKRFRNPDADETAAADTRVSSKVSIIAGIIITVSVVIAVVIMFTYGAREPDVTVNPDSISISGMYGTTVSFGDIREVHLYEQSMKSIGIGSRRSGLTVGDIYKGLFSKTGYGDGLLFVRGNSSPVIRIERSDSERDIFISFNNGDKTRELYEKIVQIYS